MVFVNQAQGKLYARRGSGRPHTAPGGQSIPYQGPCTGKVIAAVRTENIGIIPAGSAAPAESCRIEGRLASQFYLGDVNDCRVDIGGETIRVIAGSLSYDSLKEGQEVFLLLRELIVCRDDGSGGAGIVT